MLLAVFLATALKSEATNVTVGMPSVSAITALRTAAVVHDPQPPFPLITMSHPFSFNKSGKSEGGG